MAASGDVGIGWDLAGVVDAVGPGMDRFRAGDAVIGMRDLLTAPVGAQAEQVVLEPTRSRHAPRSVPPREITVPLNGYRSAGTGPARAHRPVAAGHGSRGRLGGFARELPRSAGSARRRRRSRDEELVRTARCRRVRRSHPRASAKRFAGSSRQACDGALDAALVGMAALDAVRDEGSFVAVSAGAAPAAIARHSRAQRLDPHRRAAAGRAGRARRRRPADPAGSGDPPTGGGGRGAPSVSPQAASAAGSCCSSLRDAPARRTASECFDPPMRTPSPRRCRDGPPGRDRRPVREEGARHPPLHRVQHPHQARLRHRRSRRNAPRSGPRPSVRPGPRRPG